MNETVHQNSSGVSIGNVILGIWVAISPFVLGFSGIENAKWNDVATGLAVMLLAMGRGPQMIGPSVLNVLLGAWLIASPFVLGFNQSVPFWNNIILGVVILIVAAIAASSARTTVGPPPGGPTPPAAR